MASSVWDKIDIKQVLYHVGTFFSVYATYMATQEAKTNQVTIFSWAALAGALAAVVAVNRAYQQWPQPKNGTIVMAPPTPMPTASIPGAPEVTKP